MHPLYADPALVARVTMAHLGAGRSVFQVFQLDADERAHSLRVLELLHLPERARVLSLGCGVGGMERYWLEARPDLTFELVNNSAEQLGLTVCPGRTVQADAQDYVSGSDWFDCVVLAYVLGHLDVQEALRSAQLNVRKADPWNNKAGLIAVLDAFDATPKFNQAMHYQAPTSVAMRACGFWPLIEPEQFKLSPFIAAEVGAWVATDATPGLWVRRRG